MSHSHTSISLFQLSPNFGQFTTKPQQSHPSSPPQATFHSSSPKKLKPTSFRLAAAAATTTSFANTANTVAPFDSVQTRNLKKKRGNQLDKMMQVRDAAGRQVSLLNDDSPRYPNTPELLRSDSYDSQISGYDALSPLTPTSYDYAHRPLYDEYISEKPSMVKRPSYVESHRSNSYDDDSASTSAAPERAGKRYPCRYRDSHGCEKTFTTSGHASRHSKIHTAEKAVQCTYPACHKKFTRADNMKQHLETHYKDKSRSSTSSKSTKNAMGSSKRASISSRSTASTQSSSTTRDTTMWDADQYCGYDGTRLPSPGSAWDVHSLNLPMISRHGPTRTSSGLDALAAIACQEGS